MTASPFRSLLLVLAGLVLPSIPLAQAPGQVLTFQKISETSGGFTGLLGQDDGFGRSVARIGDVDGDGIEDLAVGAIFHTTPQISVGAVWILFLNSAGTVRSQVRISQLPGTQSGDLFGNSVAGLGDVNGDSVPDIAVGAPNDDDGGINRGAVYFIFLRSDGTALSSTKVSSRQGGFTGPLDNTDFFGIAVQSLGDIDGDGVSELAVGATGDDDGGTDRGAVWILSYDSAATLVGERKISALAGGFAGSLADQDRFGGALAAIGDLNGDAVTDLAVGAGRTGSMDEGAVWILFLQSDGTVLGQTQISTGSGGFSGSLAANDRFGSSLAALGDLDTDGIADLAVGALDNDGGPDRGAVWILFLASDGTVRGYQKLSSLEGNFRGNLKNGDLFGSGVANVGDLNGDGHLEIAVGARNDDDGDAPNQGAVYVLSLQGGPAAPPTVSFSATPLSGSAPLAVTFTDQSTGNVMQWSWDFGDGATSTLRNPTHVYGTPGSYAVALTATGLGGSSTDSRLGYVQVSAPVTTANFTAAPTTGPAPLVVTFTDLSTGSPTTWTWDFGDGTTSTLQNPSHTYTSQGTYSVSVTVAGPNGTDTLLLAGLVVVSPPAPTPAFSATPTTGPAPLFVSFTDLTTGEVTAWNWRFGDGAGSAIQNPGHVYADPGTYDVRLTATGPGGEGTLIQAGLVVVEPPGTVANFETNPLTGEVPLLVTFTDRSTGGATSWSWDFGDGTTSTLQSPTHLYGSVGTYTVSLTAAGPAGTDTLTRTDHVVVTPIGPRAGFTTDLTSGPAPLTVSFSDTSTGNVTAWSWRFGDASGSAQQNPIHTYTDPGTYSVILTVSGPDGDDSLSRPGMIVVDPPGTRAAFDATPVRGEVPLTVVFTDRSTASPTAWSWDFGDGTTSTIQNPTHTYTTVGTYTVALTATGASGTDTRTRANLVVVNPVGPTAAFTADPPNGPAPLAVQFTDLSTGNVTAWSWRFGDGLGSVQQHPVHTYTNPGTYSVILTASGPDGEDSLSLANLIVVDPPGTRAAFNATPTRGEVPLAVTFTDRSTGGATSWSWDFGDGTSSTLQNPTHTYSAIGTYTVALTANGASGLDTRTRTDLIVVNPVGPTAAFSPDVTTGRAPLSVAFTDLSTGNITSWSWRFGDGSGSATPSPIHTYTAAGTYSVILTVSGPDGEDSLSQAGLIVVDPPGARAAFSANPTRGEVPLTVTFTDRSTGGASSFFWDFGDGATSTAQNPTHVYAAVGTYTVSLTIDGTAGVDTSVRTGLIVVNPVGPTAAFSAAPSSGPEPLTVQFTDLSTGNVTAWTWRFGDGSGSAQSSPVHTYTQQGTYSVVLTATGPDGEDTLSQAGLIVVDPPNTTASFTAAPTRGEVPLTVTFTDRSIGSPTSWNWDFGDGSTSTLQNPTHVYSAVGTYTVALTTNGPSGLDTRTRTDLIVVNPVGPTADFSASPVTGPAPLLVAFTDLSTGNVTSYNWRFGDASGSNKQSPNHSYDSPGTYSVVFTVSGPDGTDSVTRTNLIAVGPPQTTAAFTALPRSGEIPLTVGFVDLSSGGATSWAWDFGDGTTSTLQNPTHVYTAVGTYTVSLTATGPNGTDTNLQPGFVIALPVGPQAAFTATPTSGEPPLVVAFTDQSTGNVTSWSWRFGDGGTSTLQSPNHAYTNQGSYSVTLTVTGPEGQDTVTQLGLITVLPPVTRAAFTAAPTSGEAPLTVDFTDQSRGAPTSWTWDFGDGTSSTSRNPAHVYTVPGTYSVTLTASGPNGTDTVTQTGLVTVLQPVTRAIFTANPTSGGAPLTVNFINQSTGSPDTFVWDFGDGNTSTLQSPTHTYAAQGTYTVSLTASGPNGSDTLVQTDMIAVGPLVTRASFTATPRTGVVPVRVNFRNFSTGAPTSYQWDFGDGGTSTLSDPTHIYTSAGTYTVSLTADGPNGTDTLVKPDLIVLTEPPLVADFSASPISGISPLTVTFTDATTGGATSWTWDFGDGTSSTLQNPTHTYTVGGLFTVSLTAGRPSGTDTLTQVDLIDVTPGAIPPGAAFNANPVSGPAPLTVVFADLSTGDVTGWNWDFGDGSISTLQNPTHVYTDPGSYTVGLTATGPAGSDTLELAGLVQVQLTPEILDGSFEAQVPGQLPAAPWIVVGGLSHVVRPTLLPDDNGMPSGGLQWLEVSGDGSVAASPPSNPGGPGIAPSGVVGVRQDFALDLNQPFLVMKVAFVLNEPPAQNTTNDFMSVDVSDGIQTHNLFYADSFSTFPNTSAIHALPMTDVIRITEDLRALFPTLLDGSPLTLTISVGNGGDGANPSLGYVDEVLLAPVATATPRNGLGINPPCYTAAPPVIGSTWTGSLDTAHHPGATFGVFYAFSRGTDGLVLDAGELLIDIASSQYFTLVAPVVNGTATVDVPIRPDLALIGLGGASQGVTIGNGSVFLCNAVDVLLGF